MSRVGGTFLRRGPQQRPEGAKEPALGEAEGQYLKQEEQSRQQASVFKDCEEASVAGMA